MFLQTLKRLNLEYALLQRKFLYSRRWLETGTLSIKVTSMLHGLGYRCRIRVCVRHGYCLIFVSFSIYLKDRSVIPMSEYVSDTGVGQGYFRENEESM